MSTVEVSSYWTLYPEATFKVDVCMLNDKVLVDGFWTGADYWRLLLNNAKDMAVEGKATC